MEIWPFGKSEHRQDAGATDAVVTALLSAASGAGSPSTAGALAAVETAAGLWSRALGSALVTPTTALTRALTPSVLASMGRELAVRGESVHVLDLDGGGVTLTPASRWEITGGTRPESWRYAVEFPLPGGRVVKRTLPGAGVIHLRYAVRPNAPWAGVSPLGMASETQALAGWLEKRLAQEVSTSTGYVLTVPDGAEDGNVSGLASKLAALAGKLFVTETVSKGWGAGETAAPKRDYETTRLGANPPASLAALRQDLRADVLAVYGVPSALHGSGTSARESYRQMLQGTIVPLSKLVVEELAAKLDTPTLSFDFRELRAADIAGRARAYGVLINAGMPPAEAAEATGLD